MDFNPTQAEKQVKRSLAAAMEMAENGFPVVPAVSFRDGDRIVKRPDSRHGFKDATCDAAQITQWWREKQPTMLAIATGKASGLAVLDLDTKVDADTGVIIDGNANLAAYMAQRGLALPATVEAVSPSGGRHLYFKHRPEFSRSKSHSAVGIDYRSDGGMIICPPSINCEGGEYKFAHSFSDTEVADMPDWLAELFEHDRLPGLIDSPVYQPKPEGATTPTDSRRDDVVRALDGYWNPDSFEDWTHAALALHGFEGGREIWLAWAKASTKFVATENSKKWEACKPTKGITVASIMARVPKAMLRDWGCEHSGKRADEVGDKPKDKPKTAENRVTREEVEGANPKTTSGVNLIYRYRMQMLEDLNEEMGLAIVQGKGVLVRRGRNAIGELVTEFISKEAESMRLANVFVPYVEGGEKDARLEWQPIFPVWMKWDQRRTYDGVRFDPMPGVVNTESLPPAAPNGRTQLNLFIGVAWEPVAGDCQMILDHIKDVLCGGEDEAFRYTMNWLARMVQEPFRPAETVLVLRSEQGLGKNTITNLLKRYFGSHGIELTNDRDLVGFNDHLATSIFISLNEATWGGNKSHEGQIKSLVTDPYILVERKYLPKFSIQNNTHLIVSSNNEWVVPVGHDDRRYVVLNPSGHRIGDTGYFNALHKHIMEGGQQAFIHHLMKIDVSSFNPRKLPAVGGDIKLDQKMRSANTVAKWLHGVLEEGGLMVEEPKSDGRKEEVFLEISTRYAITKDALYADYMRTCRGDRAEPKAQFGKSLLKILGPAVDGIRKRAGFYPAVKSASGYSPIYCYGFRTLPEVRDAFADYMREKIEWADGGSPEQADDESGMGF